MQQRTVGSSDLRVSLVGLGCNNFGVRTSLDEARAVVDRAIEQGITLFDTADVYGNRGGSEEALGEILGARRKDIVLATKFGLPMDEEGRMKGGSRRYIMRAIEASLRRLKTDWIDLYQMHTPDPLTRIEETLRALDDLVKQGKVRFLGSSNFAGWQIADAEWTARTGELARFICVQDELSLLKRGIEKEVAPAVQAYGLGFLPYFPLAGGLLTGKYRRGAEIPKGSRFDKDKRYVDRWVSDQSFDTVEALTAFAEARGHTLLDLAFSWLASRPFVSSIIAGATRPEQIDANVTAASWDLSAEDRAEINRIIPPPS